VDSEWAGPKTTVIINNAMDIESVIEVVEEQQKRRSRDV